jgi:SAM-dependent methyltransferase
VVLTNGLLLGELVGARPDWPRDRLHLQLSLDGFAEANDRIRGAGSFDRVVVQLERLRREGYPCTLSMAVGADNVRQMTDMVELASSRGVGNVHFMWHFRRGRGRGTGAADLDTLIAELCRAAERATELGVGVDNIDAMRTQVFSPGGTRHDGTNAGWESLAVGPDGQLYPTPAMVGLPEMASPVDGDLERAWRESGALRRVRRLSAAALASPLRFITGGGDPDHRLMGGGALDAPDPYLPLHERLALWLIAREAAAQPRGGEPALRLKRGEVLESCGARGALALTHSNCLLSVAVEDSRTPVRELYSRAAEAPDEEILNPVCYPEELVDHVPVEARLRSYGCGSPVVDARLAEGESLVDLGSGTGVECLVAARLVGPRGSVVGVDMLEPMLSRARRGADAVARRLGYANVTFRRGYLEALPLPDDSADVVISNCVINLSVHKRRTFAEILRVLRPGGRLVVSDVVCETEPPAAVRSDDRLKGECIAGALTGRDLFGLLRETGFVGARVLRRFPYREVQGHPFFSLTFEARRPSAAPEVRALYRGPFEAVMTRGGQLLFAGQPHRLPADEVDDAWQSVMVLSEGGGVENLDMGTSPCCAPGHDLGASHCCAPASEGPGPTCGCAPESAAPTGASSPRPALVPALSSAFDMPSGCMVCGEELCYLETPCTSRCAYCGQALTTQTLCRTGHFVCDACHARDALRVVEHLCGTSRERDMVAMLERVRSHPAIHTHGPEHHALVPAIMVATYRNLGGGLSDRALRTAVDRGARVPGGFCGFAGTCGAAVGVGIGFSVILGVNPYHTTGRRDVQRAAAAALASIAGYEAARCCQRDCWLALRSAAESSRELLPFPLPAEAWLSCNQVAANRECLGRGCPLFVDRRAATSASP